MCRCGRYCGSYNALSMHFANSRSSIIGTNAITARLSKAVLEQWSRRLLTLRSTVRAAVSCSILLVAWCVLLVPAASSARAQGTPTSVQLEAEKLERDFTDPLSTLPQLILRDSYTPANYRPCTPQACVRNYETKPGHHSAIDPTHTTLHFAPVYAVSQANLYVGDSAKLESSRSCSCQARCQRTQRASIRHCRW